MDSPTECGVYDRDGGTSRMGHLDPLELSSLVTRGGGGIGIHLSTTKPFQLYINVTHVQKFLLSARCTRSL